MLFSYYFHGSHASIMAVADRVGCTGNEPQNEQELIASYFDDGYTYAEICTFLHLRHNISLTVDQLRYRLKRMGRQPEQGGVTHILTVGRAATAVKVLTGRNSNLTLDQPIKYVLDL